MDGVFGGPNSSEEKYIMGYAFSNAVENENTRKSKKLTVSFLVGRVPTIKKWFRVMALFIA